MSQYYIFSDHDAVDYAQHYVRLTNKKRFTVAEKIIDERLNQLFKVNDNEKGAVLVKQALPFNKDVSVPSVFGRVYIEPQVLMIYGEHAPAYTAKVLRYDPEFAVMMVEDYSHFRPWQYYLSNGDDCLTYINQLAICLANIMFHTSDFYQSYQHKRSLIAQLSNPELCRLNETKIFVDPYCHSSQSEVDKAILEELKQFAEDKLLRLAVARLKHEFMSRTESLAHGNLIPSSIVIHQGKIKIINADFGFYAPMGFDIGTVLASLLLSYCAANGRYDSIKAHQVKTFRRQEVVQLWTNFSTLFSQLVRNVSVDPILSYPGYIEQFLQYVWQSAIGFCGAELVRRTINNDISNDLSTIQNSNKQLICQKKSLQLGRLLMVQAKQIHSVNQFIEVVRQVSP